MLKEELDFQISQIEKDLEIELQNIPDSILELFTDKALNDAVELIKNKNAKNLQLLTYSLYRAYILGLTMGKRIK